MSNFVESRDSHIKLKYRIPLEGLSNLLESSDGAFLALGNDVLVTMMPVFGAIVCHKTVHVFRAYL